MDKRTVKMVEELKRRRAFVSLIVTRTNEQITWWDGHEMRTGDADSVGMWLRSVKENERREIQRAFKCIGYAR